MNATRMLRPSAISPLSVDGPSAMMSLALIFWPFFTMGFWLKFVPALERMNLRSS
jgi:hypothetical protein